MASKRERELARAKWERQQARRSEQADKQSVIKRSVLAGVAVIAVIVLVLANNDTSSPSASPERTNPPMPTPTLTTAPPVKTSTPSASTKSTCASHGPLVSTPKTFSKAPTDLPTGKNLTLQTNCGTVSIALDPRAPKTTQIMSNLANKNYFDNTPCHRLTTSGIYVLQCGDPTGTGTGGPGFKFADENLPSVAANSAFNYSRGTIAMANSGPNTNGSQFFIVYKSSPLPPNYSIWGQVTSGMDVIDKIAAAGEESGNGDGKPKADVAITKASAR